MLDDWYLRDVPRLISETERLYARIVEKYPERTREFVTKQRIVTVRKWEPTLHRYEDRFEAVIRQLGCFYIPKIMPPGPAFVFPIKDVDGTYSCAQTKPLEGSALAGKTRYRYIGDKPVGPRWLGNDPATLRLIIEKRAVMCVEGPFDLLAMRLMSPEYPILSPLTKFLGKNHIAYLRMLGVKQLFIMFDNEVGGEEAMEQQARQVKSMAVKPCACPRKDPSAALEEEYGARDLARWVKQSFGR